MRNKGSLTCQMEFFRNRSEIDPHASHTSILQYKIPGTAAYAPLDLKATLGMLYFKKI